MDRIGQCWAGVHWDAALLCTSKAATLSTHIGAHISPLYRPLVRPLYGPLHIATCCPWVATVLVPDTGGMVVQCCWCMGWYIQW